jgi:hypothetical protein
MLNALLTGDLLLADRYYCTFAIIALLQAKGIPVLFPLHANKKADFRQGSKLGAKDHLVEWKKPKRKPVWMAALDYANLPEVITVREFKVKGVVYVTTMLNAKQFHKQELASLYKERWKIEIDQPCCLHKSVLRKLLYRFCDWFYPGTINSPQFT